jgi:hypothetical protein
LKLRHNLNIMLIEKNICENILVMLMNINGKINDTIKARRCLQLLGIRKKLYMQPNCATYKIQLVKYTLTRDEKMSLYK